MFYLNIYYKFSGEHSTIVYLCGLVLLFTPVGWGGGEGLRPCGGVLIMFRPLGCSPSDVPRFR